MVLRVCGALSFWRRSDWSHKSRLSKIELRVITDDDNSLDGLSWWTGIVSPTQYTYFSTAAGACGGGSEYTTTLYYDALYFALLRVAVSGLRAWLEMGETFVVRIHKAKTVQLAKWKFIGQLLCVCMYACKRDAGGMVQDHERERERGLLFIYPCRRRLRLGDLPCCSNPASGPEKVTYICM